MRRCLQAILILSLFSFFIFLLSSSSTDHRCIHVCDWFGQIPQEVLEGFEKETGIKVIYDAIESNDVLEAKLLAGKCGWDVVFPSSSPYLMRQIRNKCYLPLKKNMIPNMKYLDLVSLEQGKKIDPDLLYSIPYIWGTMGFVINPERLSKYTSRIQSYDLLFSPTITKKIKHLGISLLPEVDDVFSVLLHYLNISPHTTDTNKIQIAAQHIAKIRPQIRKFTAGHVVNDMVMGELSVAQCWSHEGIRAVEEAAEIGKKLLYVLPEEGTLIWADHIAVPKDAPHPDEAFLFINYLLNPKIAAKVTENTNCATSIKDAHRYLKNIHSAVYPPKEYLKKCYFENVTERLKKPGFDRYMSSLWAAIRYGF